MGENDKGVRNDKYLMSLKIKTEDREEERKRWREMLKKMVPCASYQRQVWPRRAQLLAREDR